LKLLLAGAALALIETLNAKIRIFRAPEFLGTAFMLAVLGLLVRLLEVQRCDDDADAFAVRSPTVVNLFASVVLLLSFAMLAQRRIRHW
jgi:hypothetical protein